MEVDLVPLVYYILEDPNSIRPEYRKLIEEILKMNLSIKDKQNITKLRQIIENLEKKNPSLPKPNLSSLVKNPLLKESPAKIEIQSVDIGKINLISIIEALVVLVSFSLIAYTIIKKYSYKLEKNPLRRYMKYLHSLGKKYYETNREFIAKLPTRIKEKLWVKNLEFERLVFGGEKK